MGLDQLASQSDSSSSGSSGGGSSSSGSSSSSSGTKASQEILKPVWAVIRTDDGLKGVHRDNRASIVMEDGEVIRRHQDVVRHWTSFQSFLGVQHLVERELSLDLVELLKDDAKLALRAIDEAENCADPSYSSAHRQRCDVCEENIHAVFTEYVDHDDGWVCSEHTAKELQESDVL